MRRRLYVHPWVWAMLAGALLWSLVFATCCHAQGLAVDRQTTRWLARGMLGEPQTTFLADSTLNRFVNYGQHLTMLALGERTSVVIDTFITVTGRLRYEMVNVAVTTSDTIQASRVAAVIQKSVSAAGSEEVALAYIPSDLLGKPQSGVVPAFYSVLGRNLLLGKSPNGGDTLFVYMLRVPRDLTTDATLLSVSKEDQLAVALAACVMWDMADNQIQRAQLRWQLWQAAIGLKGYPQLPSQVQGGQ